MGFTRYWQRPKELEQVQFRLFARDCERICADLDVELIDPIFDDEQVSFEAKPCCESFSIKRISSNRERDGKVSEFCKTQKLPYDLVVSKCIESLKKNFGEEIVVPNPS